MTSDGSAILSRSEILDIKVFSHIDSRSQIMLMLKDKGAPVKGHFLPMFDTDYTVNSYEDYETGSMHVSWEKLNEKA